MFKQQVICICLTKNSPCMAVPSRGVPISKLTNIPTTDILVIKHTNTDIASPFN